MAPSSRRNRRKNSSGAPSTAALVAEKIFAAFGWLREIVDAVAHQANRILDEVQRRLFRYLLSTVLLAAGAVFSVLGLFFFLIDFAGWPRAGVFGLGGVILLLLAVIYEQSFKVRKKP